MDKDVKISEIEVKEHVNGELYFDLPDDLLNKLDWEEGDQIKFIEQDGGFLLKKVKYESIEVNFDDEKLFKYMKHAHEQGLSFNDWVEKALERFIKHAD